MFVSHIVAVQLATAVGTALVQAEDSDRPVTVEAALDRPVTVEAALDRPAPVEVTPRNRYCVLERSLTLTPTT